jgi:hypothetical protein
MKLIIFVLLEEFGFGAIKKSYILVGMEIEALMSRSQGPKNSL